MDRVLRAVRAPRYTVQRRSLVALGLILVAFHYSLSTLIRSLKEQTPLAYLGLVPIIALLLAAANIREEGLEPKIHDRQVDYIIGVPLVVVALALLVFMPVRMSTIFWLYRMDLLALPLFVAGTIALLFGVRALWRLRIPVAFLVLAWPLPYTTLLVTWLGAFTGSTLSGLNFFIHHVDHAAVAAPSQGQGVYFVRHGGATFPVSIVSACSGVNGIVGYALISIAFITVVVGSWLRKMLWLVLGLGAVWLSNVVRIFAIVVAGSLWGRRFALDILHPALGLVTFNLVVIAMLAVMGKFGLRLRLGRGVGDATISQQARRAVPTIKVAASVMAVLAAVGYVADSSLRSFSLVASDLGAPRLISFSSLPSQPRGWSVSRTNVYTWATPFFGEDSTWYRYAYEYRGDPHAPLQANATVISDVINTSDLGSFSTYGIEACYRFHGYKLHSIRTVDLGGGVTGNVLAYYNTSTQSDWTTVYWHWPVRTDAGKTRYERVVLMLLNTSRVRFTVSAPSSSIRSVGLAVQNAISGSGTVDARFARAETFLVQFGRAIIGQQAVASRATSGTGSLAARHQ
jgi:exosortase/archaeosortase family protein